MQWYEVVVLAIYACLTVTLIVLKSLNVGSRRRGVVKMATALLFLATAIVGCVRQGGGLSVILTVGLLFASLGDLFLVFMDKRFFFIAGVLSFGCASLSLSVYSIINYGWSWWPLIPFGILVGLNVFAQAKGVYRFGKNSVYLNVYSVLVSACGSLGLVLFCHGVANVSAFVFGLGCFMYLASDIFLGTFMLSCHKRYIDAINTALYFPGMFLIALSLFL